MAAINSNNDPQFEIYRQRVINETAKGNLVMVKALAKKNPQLLNVVNEKGCTLLHIATALEQLDVIEWLLSNEGREAGFSSVLSRMSEGKFTALLWAATKGNLDYIKAIAFGCKQENGEREQMLNSVNDEGLTVLHYAAMQGKIHIIRWLLSDKKGGGRAAGFNNLFATNKDLLTALHAAAQRDNLACVIAIVEGCKVENREREKLLNATAYGGTTILHLAADHGHLSTIKWILTKGREYGFECILAKDIQGSTAFLTAVARGHLDACKAIAEGCKVGEEEVLLNGYAIDGSTALHLAGTAGHTSIVSWLLSDKPGGGRALGFNNILARTKDGLTALHWAAQEEHLEACKAIVKGCKAENGEREKILNAVDKEQLNILHYAANYGYSNMISWLLSNNADGGRAQGFKSESITVVAKAFSSALQYAVRSGSLQTLRALLSGCTAGEKLKLFLAPDDKGWSVLHQAVRFSRVDMIREFLLLHPETKTIVDHRDLRGMTALHRAVLDGGFDVWGKGEWKAGIKPTDPNRAPREEVVAALLTYEFDDDDEGGGSQAASSTKKGNNKKKVQQPRQQQQQKQHHQQQEQAAFIDVNAGFKIE